MLEEVNKPGSDIEEYLAEIERILEEKNASILDMRQSLAAFRKNIERENILNEKMNGLRKRSNVFYQGENHRDYPF